MSQPSSAPPPEEQQQAKPDAAAMRPEDTVVRVYNKFLIDMVINLKGANAGIKKALKAAGHKAIDPTSVNYIEHAVSTIPRAAMVNGIAPCDALADARVCAFEPINGLSIGVIAEGASDDGAHAVRSYLYILATLCVTFTECRDGNDGNDVLVTNVLDVLSRVQTGEDADDALDGIMDDDIAALLEHLGSVSAAASAAAAAKPQDAAHGLDDVMKTLENSKIADLAKEIAAEIDVSQLASVENPMDFLNFANMSDSNSMLGNIVSKVGSKIQNKLASGEIRHDELLSEAVSLLKAFDTNNAFANNPMISNMMQAAKCGMDVGGQSARSTSARNRLRQKLERKHQRTQSPATEAGTQAPAHREKH